MQVTVGYSENPDSKIAAREATQSALSKATRSDVCDMVLLFTTSSHNQNVLREEVASLTGNTNAIYGGGAVGIITNDAFGYAGNQVGVACMWLEGSSYRAIIENTLSKGEFESGEALGKKLAEAGVEQDTPVMLFYDSIREKAQEANMIMATWLLQGLEKGLGYFPDMNGAGMQADFSGSVSSQFVGDKLEKDTAIALTFSDDVCIDSVIMHGCHPASTYYTVTKSEGAMILEINGEPAIPFIDKVIGGTLRPEQYPFFLLFGINHGERWGEYDEKNYASRLCLGIAPEQNGIIMFEPDMVPGTEFQLMFRSLGMEYMKPKIDDLMKNLNGRKPVFAVYINCAGRCAGYNGVDTEDAYVIQEAMGDKIPLLGLYTGVEIAEIGGRPRGLDWTGVLCIFSVKEDGAPRVSKRAEREVWQERILTEEEKKEIPIDSVLQLCEQNVAKVLALDTQSIVIRQELEQKRRGFRLLTELFETLHRNEENTKILKEASLRINAALNMQRTLVLLPDSQGCFIPTIMHGYSDEEQYAMQLKQIQIDSSLLDLGNSVLVTGASDPAYLADLREAFGIHYFTLSPIVVENDIAAILVSGRMVEAPPFLSRLSLSDVENVQAISALLSSMLVYERLDHEKKRANTDILTGLLNRGALEAQASNLLQNQQDENASFALMIIDFDYFKQVNDTYGHLTGDTALKELAALLSKSFRSTDLVGRIGGDEFVVFCSFHRGTDALSSKVDHLLGEWSKTPIPTQDGGEAFATLSIGVSLAPHDGKSYSELFAKADLALYHSKEHGRNRFTIYEDGMGE